ncbi:nucleotidyl transferase AbiEii/AbiGii toxin family protein [Pseudomaricurvus alcaniphilus]|uniref:nucleotidyl transferase AbiEii/AbiGii toxin family protein n=1 Tax=Pseudomaricurvus alcaniphilus TaxID=1166482 RepID=UPI00140A664D|nr:nucleotidyl transferase AbiEii/AbiGii toxin family protein [Pseudomaricurvus alcaniphilus]NHN35914.1 nucleotidyl transferase AbiEii/AbiGii toxin family protein [Pseudomaricurvus alcaniphilus]
MEVTRELVEDVAAELGINEPSLVEKDFHVVQALSLLANYHSPNFELVFAGGTCLTKIFIGLQRMSEDVDLKVLRTEQGRALGRNALRKELSALKQDVRDIFEAADFTISDESARNENHFIGFELAYTAIFDVIDALRPNIRIELTLCDYECLREDRAIASLIGQAMGEPPEIGALACIDVVHTSAEKLVSLLRRTAADLRGIKEWTDDALIRHVYDLHIINSKAALGADFVQLVHQTVTGDAERFGSKHKEFLDDAKGELKAALAALNSQAIYREQYTKFLGPLVYAQHKPDFDQGLATLNKLSELVWGADVVPGGGFLGSIDKKQLDSLVDPNQL